MPARNLIITSLALLLLLGACSGDGSASAPNSPDPSATGSSVAVETEETNTESASVQESQSVEESESVEESQSVEDSESNPSEDFEPDLIVAVRNWTEGQAIPVEFTCDGADRSPQVTLTAVPADTAAFALIVDDPDAPGDQPFVHWIVYGIDVTAREIDGGMEAFTYGRNDFGVSGWSGPCPPEGDGIHTYRWRLLALDENLELAPDLDGRAVEAAVDDHVLATAEFTATYER